MTSIAKFYRSHGRRWQTLLAACALTLSLWQLGAAATIAAKAIVAQILIAHSWQQTLLTPTTPHKPWPWADTWPVLQLQWHQKNQWHSSYILSSASGASLAFAPGLLDGSSLPNLGTTVLAAHRDTHFAFLANAKKGDELRVQTAEGNWFKYSIERMQVVDTRVTPLQINPDTDSLVLITCYPFDTLSAGGPMRLLVEAQRVQKSGN